MHASSRTHAQPGTRPSAAPHRHSSTPAHGVHHATRTRRRTGGDVRHAGGATRPVACPIVRAHRPYLF
ncbi:hypothetical protein QTN24_04820 [Cupriavidus sp. SZY C1]|uniref:hypothetical protein n=1 Tax=Cupriavidus sp. SZY C1 TaxID=3055037 RepID=UPI0028BA3204|nr:hypothetical protein [Cupriavidus sp. SZY C1]MDT6960810.1 hypothetical protein [Cupriavidus sp. SZY C1]